MHAALAMALLSAYPPLSPLPPPPPQLVQSFLFASLDDDTLKSIMATMNRTEVAAGVAIVTQGDTGSKFYIVEHSATPVVVEVDGKQVGSLGSGEHFGELALLYRCPR